MQLIDHFDALSVDDIVNSPYDGLVAYLPKPGGQGALDVLDPGKVADWRRVHGNTPPCYLVLNYEDHEASWMGGGRALGQEKGRWIQQQLSDLGLTNIPAVYISADFHPGDQLGAVLDCLRGVQDIIGAQGRAIYGFVETLEAARAAGLADYFWLCGDGRDPILRDRPWINMWQHNNDQTNVRGVVCDIDDVLTPAAFGQWDPNAPDPRGPQPQAPAAVQGDAWPLSGALYIGPLQGDANALSGMDPSGADAYVRPFIRRVQQRLIDSGYARYFPTFGADGTYGDTLAASEVGQAALQFQRDHPPLSVDGGIGRETWDAIFAPPPAPPAPPAPAPVVEAPAPAPVVVVVAPAVVEATPAPAPAPPAPDPAPVVLPAPDPAATVPAQTDPGASTTGGTPPPVTQADGSTAASTFTLPGAVVLPTPVAPAAPVDAGAAQLSWTQADRDALLLELGDVTAKAATAAVAEALTGLLIETSVKRVP
jgi:hypothetical protein